jgi:hypothetical protein
LPCQAKINDGIKAGEIVDEIVDEIDGEVQRDRGNH